MSEEDDNLDGDAAAAGDPAREEELFRQWIATHDPKAFEALVMRLRGHLHNTAMSLLHDTGDSQDAVQDAFAALVKNRTSVEPRHLRQFLAKVMHDSAIDALRRRHPHLIIDDDLSDALPDPSSLDPSRIIGNAEIIERVWAIVARMSETDQEVLLGRYKLGLSPAELVDKLHIPLDAVRQRLSRAERKLISLIGDSAPNLFDPIR